MVGKSHDVVENKATYFGYPTILMKIKELQERNRGVSQPEWFRFSLKAIRRRQKAVGGIVSLERADG
ncbi:MAG: hypothetical protein ACLQOO_17195 [Terriglobia bacterium]